jgi:hypothetical protein
MLQRSRTNSCMLRLMALRQPLSPNSGAAPGSGVWAMTTSLGREQPNARSDARTRRYPGPG